MLAIVWEALETAYNLSNDQIISPIPGTSKVKQCVVVICLSGHCHLQVGLLHLQPPGQPLPVSEGIDLLTGAEKCCREPGNTTEIREALPRTEKHY